MSESLAAKLAELTTYGRVTLNTYGRAYTCMLRPSIDEIGPRALCATTVDLELAVSRVLASARSEISKHFSDELTRAGLFFEG